MTFLSWTFLFGLVGVAIPILIHLLNRRRAKVVNWGAMQFLLASLAARNRRILIEEIILMVLRCLLVALVVLAMARPFLPSRSSVPWAAVLPAALAGAICAGIGAAMWSARKARWCFFGAAALLLSGAVTASAIEQFSQGQRWTGGGEGKDLAVVIDGSSSMTLSIAGKTNFQRAVDEARAVLAACRPADAACIILAGPVPQAVVASPTGDRGVLGKALDDLAPANGSMGPLEAFSAAVTALAEGHNPAKRIILITDGQKVGWELGAPAARPPEPPGRTTAAEGTSAGSGRGEARWQFLAKSFQALPTEPQVIVRTLPLPETFRNAAITSVAFSRRVIGNDREVGIDVKVANTGNVPLPASAVELAVDGVSVLRQQIGEIIPGAAETARFAWQFDEPGYHVVTAKLLAEDDLQADNVAPRVVHVIESLPVLIVNGSPSSGSLGPAAFIELALAPRQDDAGGKTPQRPSAPPAPQAVGLTSRPYAPAMEEADLRFLISPTVIAAPDIGRIKTFQAYRLVILADVPRLPAAAGEDLQKYVRDGGGLLIVQGDRAEPSFYNSWASPDGECVCPAQLGQKRRSTAAAPVRFAAKTFSHPALELMADPTRSDAEAALIKAYWPLRADEKDAAVRVGGLLDSGDPVLVERKFGKGYVLMMPFSLDRQDTNLPSLKCFVPMVHELAYYLAAPMLPETNVKPGSGLSIDLLPAARDPRRDATRLETPAQPGQDLPPAAKAWLRPGQAGPVLGDGIDVVTPSNRRRQGAASIVDGALRLSYAGTDEPGLYHFELSPALRQYFVAQAPAKDGLPFVVLNEPDESSLAALTSADFDRLGKFLKLFRAQTTDELTAAFKGNVPGEELWKYLAIGALLALVGEIVLTRWIAMQRRAHQVQTVTFGADAVDVRAFRSKAKEMLAIKTQTQPQGLDGS